MPVRADVYERLTPRGKKATFKTLLLTQLVSGIWHGLFAGYVLFFATSAFLFESAKVIYRYEQGLGRRWDFLRTFPPLLFLKFLYTGFVLNYSATAFLVSSIMAEPALSHSCVKQKIVACCSPKMERPARDMHGSDAECVLGHGESCDSRVCALKKLHASMAGRRSCLECSLRTGRLKIAYSCSNRRDMHA